MILLPIMKEKEHVAALRVQTLQETGVEIKLSK